MTLTSLLFWGVLLFALMVTAAFIGATAALRTYFGDDEFAPSDVVRIDDSDD